MQGSDVLEFQMGTVQGIYPWVSTLVMGNLMVRRFWVGRGCFLRGLGGEEKVSGHGQQGRSLDDTRFQTDPFCYILYVEQWGFHCSMPSGHREGNPRSSMPWVAHVRCSSFDNPSTCSTHEDSGGATAPRSVTDSTEQWV